MLYSDTTLNYVIIVMGALVRGQTDDLPIFWLWVQYRRLVEPSSGNYDWKTYDDL